MRSIALAVCLALVGSAAGYWFKRSPPPPPPVDVTHQLLKVSEVGDLVALTAHVKEIGEWHQDDTTTYRGKKLILVCEFVLDYKFPLRNIDIQKSADGTYAIKLRPCFVDCNVRDFHIYHEQDGSRLGYPVRITTGQRNRAIEAARKSAMDSALESKAGLIGQAESSAKRTMAMICQGLGLRSDQYTIEFEESDPEIVPHAKSVEDAVDESMKKAP